MSRPILNLLAGATMLATTNLAADDGHFRGHIQQRTYPVRTAQPHNVYGDQHRDDHGHYYDHRWDHDWEHRVHAPDLRQLDEFSDRLAKIAQHLHQDAHKLSQDYEHSRSIEGYVDQLDRLQEHMHHVLHDVARSGRRVAGAVEHIKDDVLKTKKLLNRLYGELRHQGFDGARTNDFYAMAHMREIIVRDAFPLVRLMESELYGFGSHAGPFIKNHFNHRARRPQSTTRRALPTLRINF